MSQPKYTPKKSGGGKSGLIVVIILIIAVLAGAAWYVFLRSTPEKTVKQFLQASEKGDKEAVVNLLSEKSKADGDSFARDINPMEGAKGGEKKPAYKIGPATITGTEAIVPVIFEVPKEQAAMMGSEFSLPMCLVKEGMQWKIDSKKTENAMMAEVMKKMGGMIQEMMKKGGGGMEMPPPAAGGPGGGMMGE
jgi:hypothetical protein